jgi:L-lactate dehydrogenase complex protein LldG
MSVQKVAERLLKALDDEALQLGLKRSVMNASPLVFKVLKEHPSLTDIAQRVRKVKDEVLENLEYYIDKTMKSIERAKADPYFVKTKDEARKLVGELVGEGKLVVKGKSMVSEEIGLRDYLIGKGNEVWETDLGELLVQLAESKPMHVIVPSIHITQERAAELLEKIGFAGGKGASPEQLLEFVRRFLRDRFVKADVGISGGNSVAADTGALVLVENEGNIRSSTNLPDIHIAIVGVEKIMPTYIDAISQALVQAAYVGIYPPTYISVIASPSSTGDIEFKKLYGVHGPGKLHVILYDGGRLKAREEGALLDQLHCIRCGRCQVECPVWQLAGSIWGGKVYGGPMGIVWTAITEGPEIAAPLAIFCLNCGRCKEVCPMNIEIPGMIRYLKTLLHR